MILHGYLKQFGFEIHQAINGFEAIDMVAKAKYDLILMDCQMPQLDGYETTRRIRSHLENECPPIVAVTAATSNSDIKKCKEAGMSGILPKPINLKAFQRLLDEVGLCPLFSESEFLKRFNGMEQMRSEIIKSYLSAAPTMLDNFRTALANRNFPEIGRAAHTLKGASSHFGAQHLVALCQTIETESKKEMSWEKAQEAFRKIELLTEKLMSEISECLKKQGAA